MTALYHITLTLAGEVRPVFDLQKAENDFIYKGKTWADLKKYFAIKTFLDCLNCALTKHTVKTVTYGEQVLRNLDPFYTSSIRAYQTYPSAFGNSLPPKTHDRFKYHFKSVFECNLEQLENVLLPFVFKLIKGIYPEYAPYFPHCLVKIHPIAQNSYLINPVSTKTGQDYFDLADSLSV